MSAVVTSGATPTFATDYPLLKIGNDLFSFFGGSGPPVFSFAAVNRSLTAYLLKRVITLVFFFLAASSQWLF